MPLACESWISWGSDLTPNTFWAQRQVHPGTGYISGSWELVSLDHPKLHSLQAAYPLPEQRKNTIISISSPYHLFFPSLLNLEGIREKQNVPNPNPKMRLTSPYDSPKNHSTLLLHPWEKQPGVTIFLGYGWRSKIDTQPDRSRAGRPEYMGSGVRPPGFYFWFPLTSFDTLSKLPCLKRSHTGKW